MGSLHCVLGEDTLFTQGFSPFKCTCVTANLISGRGGSNPVTDFTYMYSLQQPIQPGVEEILLVALCRVPNQEYPRQCDPPNTDLLTTTPKLSSDHSSTVIIAEREGPSLTT